MKAIISIFIALFFFFIFTLLFSNFSNSVKSIDSKITSSFNSLNLNIFSDLAERIMPSVVNISTTSSFESPFMNEKPEDFFRYFFDDFQKTSFKSVSLGSGFIIDSSGLIMTTNHIVANADEIKIQFSESDSEKLSDAQVIGRDPELDVAIIRTNSKRKMSFVKLGDSESLKVGEYVMAFGNPFGHGHSVTHGIISAKGRWIPGVKFGNFLQTDTPINPGNSGGPLVTLDGEVIGINNAIQLNAQGIGFAIPINHVKQILPQLQLTGRVERGYIGVSVGLLTSEIAEQMNISEDLKGSFVTNVYFNGPADKAGVKPYDIIMEFNGKPVVSPNDLIAWVNLQKPGETANLKILRDRKEIMVVIRVGSRPGAELEKERPKHRGTFSQKKIKTGMMLKNMTPELVQDLNLQEALKDGGRGVFVSDVILGGAADFSGIIPGDIILEVDRKPVKSVDEFNLSIKLKERCLLRIIRLGLGGASFVVAVLDMRR